MVGLRKYRWSLYSIGVTVGAAFVVLTVIQYLNHRGIWRPESSPLASAMSIFGALALLLSFALAVTGISKERPPILGIIALCLSIMSFMLYVQ
jgi:hypothetical protein